jgi:hypothetical protein
MPPRERKGSDEPKSRRLIGVTMRAPGVSVTLEKETVGELTERYIDDEHRSQRRSAFVEAAVSVLGLVVGAVSLAAGTVPLGDNAVALVAALAGIFGIGALTAAWSLARSVQRQARSKEEEPLPQSLLILRERLGSMREPLLNRSVGLAASEKKGR